MLTTPTYRSSLLLGIALLISPVAGAKQTGWTADLAGQELSDIQNHIETVGSNYTQRVGIIGSADAKERFDDALVQYLTGDYKSAAETFYVLLETEALHGLEGFDYEREAEWYIADSAYRIDQYALLEEYAYRIIEQPGHLFFTDAVRLLLESYGRRDRPEDFQKIYRRFVITGQVESSDELNYSIGKSFYFQGDTSQAKQALFEVLEGSPLWYKTQYFLGGVYVSEGNFDQSIEAFQGAINPNATKQDEIHLNELANIAIARVYYEKRDFLTAVSYYEKIPYSSPYFLDRLYETSWSLIGLERWNDAIDVIKIFIEAFPENEHAPQFKNTLGDLYLQIKQYEQAQKNYTQVIEQMEPVYDRLQDLMAQQALVEELLDAKLQDKQDLLNYKLPENVETRLFKDPVLTKTVEVVSLTTEQRKDVTNAQDYIQEIEAVLANQSLPLHSFAQDRSKLSRANERMLLVLLESLEHEVSILIASNKNQTSLKNIEREVALLREHLESDQEKARQAQLLLEQEVDPWVQRIQRVQDDARVAREMTNQMLDDVEQFLTDNTEVLAELSKDERQFIIDSISEIEQQMQANHDLIKDVISADTQELLVMYLGRDQYYRHWIDTVQKDAAITQRDSDELLQEVNHFLDDNASSVRGLPAEQLADLTLQLDELRSQLERNTKELMDISSARSKNVLLAKLGVSTIQDADLTGYLYELQEIHNRLFPMWSTSTLKNRSQVQQDIDGLWLSARKMNSSREDILVQIDEIEARQRPVLAKMLNDEKLSLEQFSSEVVVLAESADQLGYTAALKAFENVSDHVNQRMYGAEFGSVRVLSIRNADTERERSEMQAVRNQQIQQLNLRFSVLKSRLMSELSNE